MELPDDTPSFPKLPFIIGDAILTAIAVTLAVRTPAPLSNAVLIVIFCCAGLGACLLAIPFILDYARRENQQLDERQAGLARLVELGANTAEQASIAASGLQTISEQAQETLRALRETVSAVPAPPVTAARVGVPAEDPAVLKAQIAKLAAEFAALRQALDQRPAPTPPPPAPLSPELANVPRQIAELKTGLSEVHRQISDLIAKLPAPETEKSGAKTETAATGAKRRSSRPAREPEGDTPPLFPLGLANVEIDVSEPDFFTVSGDDESGKTVEPSPPPPAGESTASKKSPPKTPTSPTASSPATSVAKRTAAATAAPSKATPSPAEAGETTLVATAYIGIGNKLFIRGEGPGLSADKGTALQFVSIGKWRWQTPSATAPLKVSLWKNDETRCDALGEFELQPGASHEVTATF